MSFLFDKKIKIVYDMCLNICASALPIILLQLFVLPGTAERLGDEQYGLMVTLVSLNSMISLALGNVLNNVRLLRQSEYESNGLSGDFNLVLGITMIINSIVIIIVTAIYTRFSFSQIFFTTTASGFMLLKNYICVWFRIELNYKKVLIDSLIMLVGYIAGYILSIVTGVWQSIYIVGYLLGCIYILSQHNMLAEPWKRTQVFPIRIKDCAELSVATIIGSALSYVDKLLLYPLLGGAAVSVYYSATIIGKICSMLVSPISSVMLSYLAKVKTFKKKLFFGMLAFVTAIAAIAYLLCMVVSKPMLLWLYPGWAMQSLEIIKITTATAMLSLLVSVVNPVVLRFCRLNRQIMINTVSLVVYVVFCLALLQNMGLKGFALGVLFSTTIKLLLIIIIFLVDYKAI